MELLPVVASSGRENGDLEAVAPKSGVLEAAVIRYKKCHIVKFS